MTGLFDNYSLNGLALANRVVMSAMTRTRATEDGVPTDAAIAATGDFFLPSGRVDLPVPRPLSLEEIPGIVADFADRPHCPRPRAKQE
jgi:2,4-dienoyl-CoA reductase-like NADH-dependent reductase (Old Yellow Enzyme family)